jgi:hypothetical protein
MLKNIFVKEPDPKELVRKWEANVRKETRSLDKSIRGARDMPVEQHEELERRS